MKPIRQSGEKKTKQNASAYCVDVKYNQNLKMVTYFSHKNLYPGEF
jgi:hypothetical protein